MRTFLLFWVLAFMLASCQNYNMPTVSPYSPYPEISQRQPRISPENVIDFNTIWNSKPKNDKSIIRGNIKILNSSILLGELYLAKAVSTSNPEIFLLELDQSTAPRAFIDRTTGNFIFVDIEPDTYGIIAWEPMNSFPLNDSKGNTLYIQAQPGKIVDLGEIFIP